MTTFDKSGHYRTNQHGTTFWVSSHAVSHDDWPALVPRPVTRPYRHDDDTSSSRNITIPNARCPRCEDPVFFFMAANGGRVFFDTLGPRPGPGIDAWSRRTPTSLPSPTRAPSHGGSRGAEAASARRTWRWKAVAGLLNEREVPTFGGGTTWTTYNVRKAAKEADSEP